MSDRNTGAQAPRPLRIVLVVIGAGFAFGLYPLIRLWPAGFAWGDGPSHYLAMIIGLYATLGVFLMLAARDPLAHRSLIWFTVVSSIVHAAVMAGQAIGDPAERTHLVGDVPLLLGVAAVLALLMSRPAAARR